MAMTHQEVYYRPTRSGMQGRQAIGMINNRIPTGTKTGTISCSNAIQGYKP
jgi:hypothetical protein